MDQTAELEAHQRAYLQIFRAILKKKNATPEQAKAVLGKLQQYVSTRIKAPDDFLDHIPNFAKGLAVRPEALSAFIGSNLLPALENVKKQMREAEAAESAAAGPGAAGAPAVADAEVAHSVIKELEREVGTLVTEQQRFSGEDMGYLRLVSLNGGQDIPSRSLSEAMGMPSAAPAEAAAPAPAQPGTPPAAQTVTGKPASPAGGSAPAPAPVMLQESSIIGEILEQFGEELIVTGPLNVPAFPSGSGGAPAPAAAPASGGGAPAASVAAPASGTNGAPAAAAPVAAATAGFEAEPSVIAELLEQFGEELTVTGPLVLRPEAGGPPAGPGAGVAPAMGMAPGVAAAPPAPVALPEVPLSFQQYMDVVRKLQEFQTSGDQAGYRQWLSKEAGDGGKAVVGLRNVDARAKRGDAVNWPGEYEKIAAHMQLGAGQIESLHDRIARFQKLQQLLNQFIASVKTKEPSLVAAVKKIWPQVRLLFNEDWDAGAMMSRLKIPLLQIMDPAVKSQVQSLMLPLLKKAESLAKAS